MCLTQRPLSPAAGVLDDGGVVLFLSAARAANVGDPFIHALSPLVPEPKQAEPLAGLHLGRIMRLARPLLQRVRGRERAPPRDVRASQGRHEAGHVPSLGREAVLRPQALCTGTSNFFSNVMFAVFLVYAVRTLHFRGGGRLDLHDRRTGRAWPGH